MFSIFLKPKDSIKKINYIHSLLFSDLSKIKASKPFISVRLNLEKHMDLFSPTKFEKKFLFVNKNNWSTRFPSMKELESCFLKNKSLYMIEGLYFF